MQEERKSCCRIKHLNPLKSIFLLWIGTFAARGMYVGTCGHNRVKIFTKSQVAIYLKKKFIL